MTTVTSGLNTSTCTPPMETLRLRRLPIISSCLLASRCFFFLRLLVDCLRARLSMSAGFGGRGGGASDFEARAESAPKGERGSGDTLRRTEFAKSYTQSHTARMTGGNEAKNTRCATGIVIEWSKSCGGLMDRQAYVCV